MDDFEDWVDYSNPLNEGDEYSPEHEQFEEQYCEFEYYMEQLKHDVYNFHHYGHEDGPEAAAAELYGEQLLEQELREKEEQEQFDRLNPVQAFEKQKMLELEVFGSYPDSHDRYEYYGLQSEEAADEFGPEPKNEEEWKL